MTGRQIGCRRLDEHLPFQRAEWRIERVGFAGLVLVIAAALLGLGGSGPLSHSTVGNGTRLRLEFARFGRQGQTVDLRVDVARRRDDVARIWFDRAYLDGIEIEDIVPEPVESTSEGDRVVWSFRADGATTVTFQVTLQRPGLQTGQVGLLDGPTHSFTQVVYP